MTKTKPRSVRFGSLESPPPARPWFFYLPSGKTLIVEGDVRQHPQFSGWDWMTDRQGHLRLPASRYQRPRLQFHDGTGLMFEVVGEPQDRTQFDKGPCYPNCELAMSAPHLCTCSCKGRNHGMQHRGIPEEIIL